VILVWIQQEKTWCRFVQSNKNHACIYKSKFVYKSFNLFTQAKTHWNHIHLTQVFFKVSILIKVLWSTSIQDFKYQSNSNSGLVEK
jgi:hypothetical protein